MEQNIEIWKDIPGYEGYYQVSSFGRVRSLTRVVNGRTYSGKILNFLRSSNGYLQINLRKTPERKTFYIHRLVAMLYVPGYKDGLQVNHKDENKDNNYYKNLEWCSSMYNANFGTRTQRINEKRKWSRKRVVKMDIEGNVLSVYNNAYEAARKNGYSYTPILDCCKHRKGFFTFHGYVWRFETEIKSPITFSDRRKPVVQLSEDGKVLAFFATAKAAAETLNLPSSRLILESCHKHKIAYGYKWKFKNENQ